MLVPPMCENNGEPRPRRVRSRVNMWRRVDYFSDLLAKSSYHLPAPTHTIWEGFAGSHQPYIAWVERLSCLQSTEPRPASPQYYRDSEALCLCCRSSLSLRKLPVSQHPCVCNTGCVITPQYGSRNGQLGWINHWHLSDEHWSSWERRRDRDSKSRVSLDSIRLEFTLSRHSFIGPFCRIHPISSHYMSTVDWSSSLIWSWTWTSPSSREERRETI